MKRYRTIVKVFCGECLAQARLGKEIDVRCRACNYMKYNNVQDLVSFTGFLDTKHSNWVYFNVYEYIKGDNGRMLGSYKNFGDRKIPLSRNEL